MIHVNGKEVTGIFYRTKVITAVYHGANLVWQTVRSCFGSGIWRNEKPWLNEEKWKNNI